MTPELRLLAGKTSEDEYRGRLDAERRGLRYGVGRRGWSRRSPIDRLAMAGRGLLFAGCLLEIVVGIPILYVALGMPLP